MKTCGVAGVGWITTLQSFLASQALASAKDAHFPAAAPHNQQLGTCFEHEFRLVPGYDM